MKNLRGRPNNINGRSGILYISDSEDDSDFSDSDVEPVFFPPPFLPPQANILLLAAAAVGQDDTDDDDVIISDVESDLADLHDDDDEDVDSEDLVELYHANQNGGDQQENQLVSTIEVRHIVHDNFIQLQQQQQNELNSSLATVREGLVAEPTASSSSVVIDENNSRDEPPTIQETTIVISTRQREEGVHTVEINMTEQNLDLQVSSGEPHPEESLAQAQPGQEVIVEVVKCSGSTSSLVPYPDLPDYASGDEDDDDVYLENHNTVKSSVHESYGRVPAQHSSLKRKEPEEDAEDGSVEDGQHDGVAGATKASDSSPSSRKNCRGDQSEDEEETCNPMASDEEECDETEETFRGDRIGNTVYSERHVIKILMKWVEELPNHSIERMLQARENGESDEVIEKKVQRLEVEFEEQMALLWDMSAETDVMNFLVENKIFSFIRDTLDRSVCNRLTEVSLGILANVISEPSIIEDFTVHDSSLDLVEKVVELCSKVSDIAVLVQVFSVLRRIVWYLKNISSVKKWLDLLQSVNFLGVANFIMRSSRNALLLGTVIMLFYTLLDCVTPENDTVNDDTPSEPGDGSSGSIGDNASGENKAAKQQRHRLTEIYKPFCESEFVPSLCEGLKELMKNPKPANTRRKLTSTREKPAGPSSSFGCQTDDHCPNADEIDIPIPEGHVQRAILKGLSTMSLLQKASNGQEALYRYAEKILDVLLNFLQMFSICTEAVSRSNSLEYFALTLHLLSFCHTSLPSVSTDAIIRPVTTATKLISQEERDKEADTAIRVQLREGVELDSVSYIALVAHEHLATVADKFGPDCALEVRNNSAHSKFFEILDDAVSKFGDEGSIGNL